MSEDLEGFLAMCLCLGSIVYLAFLQEQNVKKEEAAEKDDD